MTARQSVPLLRTKLFVPRILPNQVMRSRLMKQLETGLSRKLTLVSAPPGFGKTTLVSAWIQSRPSDDRSFAWLSLDERDNDPTRFFTYLVEAIHLANPQGSNDARTLAASLPNVQIELVVTSLINSVADDPGQIVLVLDDFHTIDNAEIHTMMDFLIEHQPPQLHLIFISRFDPPLSLSRRRVRDEVIEIRTDELRFTRTETGAFLQKAMDREIDNNHISELERRTEGWVAGLQLATISMRGRDDIHSFINSFTGEQGHLGDYLVDEVLQRQPPLVQEFLLQVALFDRFSVDLCNAVTERDDNASMLDLIERSNLFLVALDDQRQWFRFHQLFADMLRRRLYRMYPHAIPGLRHRASLWFEKHGDPLEALVQSIAGENWERVDFLCKTYQERLFGQGQSKMLLQLTQTIPDGVVDTFPWILYTRAWSALLNGAGDVASRDMTELDTLIDRSEQDRSGSITIPLQDRRRLRGSMMTARAIGSILGNDFNVTLQLTDRALELLPEGDLEMRAMTEAFRAQSLWLCGDLLAASKSALTTIELSRKAATPLFHIMGYLSMGSIEAEWGQLSLASDYYERAVRYAADHGLSRWQYLGRVRAFQSEILYERNMLEEALEAARHGRELADRWTFVQAYDLTHLQLARIHYALHDLDSARESLLQAPPYSGYGPGDADVARGRALIILVDLASGVQIDVAEVLEHMLTPASDYLDHMVRWAPTLIVRGQVLNAIDRHTEAISIVEPVFDMCRQQGWVRMAAQAGAVLSVSHAGAGHHRAAQGVLDIVLTDAERFGFVRSVLDGGTGIDEIIASTLRRRREEGRDSIYLNRLLKVASDERRSVASSAPLQHGLAEPLSERELEVLRLIAAGFTNAEIGDQLFVAVGTVKAHTHSIYGKLGVRNRTQATRLARELRLIE